MSIFEQDRRIEEYMLEGKYDDMCKLLAQILDQISLEPPSKENIHLWKEVAKQLAWGFSESGDKYSSLKIKSRLYDVIMHSPIESGHELFIETIDIILLFTELGELMNAKKLLGNLAKMADRMPNGHFLFSYYSRYFFAGMGNVKASNIKRLLSEYYPYSVGSVSLDKISESIDEAPSVLSEKALMFWYKTVNHYDENPNLKIFS